MATATDTAEIVKEKVKEPSKYNVVILNDDITPMDFVVAVMMQIFNHSQDSAVNLTMKIHNEGSAIAGTYLFEIAEQKGMEATNLARDYDYPLVIKVEIA